MNPLISIITLTHNKLPVTRKCLTTLLQTVYRPWELIVVDNGSDDGTREWLEEFAESAQAAGVMVHRICNDGNVGCSTARNQGAAKAGGEFLVFMDNDVALRCRNWLGVMSRFLRDHPGTAIVGPKLVYPFPPHLIQCAGVGISHTGRVLFRGRGEPRETAAYNEPREVQCLISACFMVRRTVFEKTGGFDPAYNPVEFEDFDLCYKAKAEGFSLDYLPKVEMYHFESVTTAGTVTIPNTRLIIRNGLLFKKRWCHLFAKEAGPADAETRWRTVPTRAFDTIGDLPLINA